MPPPEPPRWLVIAKTPPAQSGFDYGRVFDRREEAEEHRRILEQQGYQEVTVKAMH